MPVWTLALLCLCLWACALHFLTDVVFHLDEGAQFGRPAEREPSQAPHDGHQEEQFVLPGLSFVPGRPCLVGPQVVGCAVDDRGEYSSPAHAPQELITSLPAPVIEKAIAARRHRRSALTGATGGFASYSMDWRFSKVW
jgi:hypothetical protein